MSDISKQPLPDQAAPPPTDLNVSPPITQHELSPQGFVAVINGYTRNVLVESGVSPSSIESGDVRLSTILYMSYWFHRLNDLPLEQSSIRNDLKRYIGDAAPNAELAAERILTSEELRAGSKEYVTKYITPQKTVDLFVVREGSYQNVVSDEREVLCIQRGYYPFGNALPGGFIRDSDAANPLGVQAPVFAALRVASEKILGLRPEEVEYSKDVTSEGKERLLVRKKEDTTLAIAIHADETVGFHFRENIYNQLRPSDSRHLVDTRGFKCELIGELPANGLSWRKKGEIMSDTSSKGGLAFGHHREIIAHIGSRTSLERERQFNEHSFIRRMIADPLGIDREIQEVFNKNGRNPHTSAPWMYPALERMWHSLYSPETNQWCKGDPGLMGMRELASMKLRHCMIKNEIPGSELFGNLFCPCRPSIEAIHAAVEFFDVIERKKKDFYQKLPADEVVEHNPKEIPHAYYHSYRYLYRIQKLLEQVPDQNIILTFEALDAEDLLRVRGSRNRLVGLSREFIYVDEFFQSPYEFLIHDYNHSFRMVLEDLAYMKEHGLTPDEYYQRSTAFSQEYLEKLKVRETDSEEERELKKLKKIILFEICHEDARPFLPDVIGKYLQQVEGTAVPFEGPHIDRDTGHFDIVRTMDTGIATLSYCRNKLQNGFYDQTDSEVNEIVDVRYRTSDWIARAAYEMLTELGATPVPEAEVDLSGRVSYEWLLTRTVSVGPDNIHQSKILDPTLERLRSEATSLNQKRYQL
jgi:hypothetical protein